MCHRLDFARRADSTTACIDVPEIQQLLIDQGYRWVSSLYPAHRAAITDEASWHDVRADIVAQQQASQPFVYPSGLIEIPMSPVSDVTAFRAHQWKLDQFLEAIQAAVGWTIEHLARVFDFLAHPSCLYVTDPEFRTIDLICDLVNRTPTKPSSRTSTASQNRRRESEKPLAPKPWFDNRFHQSQKNHPTLIRGVETLQVLRRLRCD